ncbi:MAG: bifunctional phosphoribosylaminoimidazolecarboxamide formyltransferase/IMP cyclohydrolase, partial [Verrucomicrobiota bacterium]|nr:bifunctional phosphoribosylaminoimidazolecarboxamide formyltransferase/IMP cyclohydrolase [Verrucomicrobiota bacterium]
MQKTALISVSDKTGLVPFAKALVEQYSYRLLSTGGTAKLLKTEGIPVTEVSDYTGFPEMMEGRVKTLHPKIHGGLLARRDKEEHMGAAVENGIDMIDLVVVNLYPFSEITSKSDVTFELAVENIDIGGPSMLRSAAKNHASVCVVIDTADYDRVLKLMGSELAFSKLRLELAVKVFERTSCYDSAIASYLKDLAGEEES